MAPLAPCKPNEIGEYLMANLAIQADNEAAARIAARVAKIDGVQSAHATVFTGEHFTRRSVAVVTDNDLEIGFTSTKRNSWQLHIQRVRVDPDTLAKTIEPIIQYHDYFTVEGSAEHAVAIGMGIGYGWSRAHSAMEPTEKDY